MAEITHLRKRAGLITRRTYDRNVAQLRKLSFLCGVWLQFNPPCRLTILFCACHTPPQPRRRSDDHGFLQSRGTNNTFVVKSWIRQGKRPAVS
ncbi:hypothetical protein PMIN04_009287 [Paraphaeosphaeria minitans]